MVEVYKVWLRTLFKMLLILGFFCFSSTHFFTFPSILFLLNPALIIPTPSDANQPTSDPNSPSSPHQVREDLPCSKSPWANSYSNPSTLHRRRTRPRPQLTLLLHQKKWHHVLRWTTSFITPSLTPIRISKRKTLVRIIRNQHGQGRG